MQLYRGFIIEAPGHPLHGLGPVVRADCEETAKLEVRKWLAANKLGNRLFEIEVVIGDDDED